MYAATLNKDDAFEVEDWAAPSGAAPTIVASSVYGSRGARRPNWIAIGFIVALHLFLLKGFLNLGFGHHERHRPKPLEVHIVPVDIAPPPPPKAVPQPQKAIVQSPIVAQTPVVQTTVTTPPPVVVAPIPQPPVPPTVIAAVAAPAPVVASGPVAVSKLSPMPGNPPLRYPTSSRMHHEEGVVRLRIVVGTSGTVEAISIDQSSGFDALDKAAMEVVRRWKFFPPSQDGHPAQGVGIFPAAFKLG